MGIALVTGGNRGIGLEVCRELARRGWEVLLAARDPSKGEAAAARARRDTGGRVEPLALDVTDPASVAAVRKTLDERGIRLDALVNNAGIYGRSDAKATLETNFFAPMRLVDALADRLADGARVVNVTSGLGALANLNEQTRRRLTDPALDRDGLVSLVNGYLAGTDPWGTDAYGVSKAALNAWTRLLARELAGRDIKVNATGPGWVRTDMGGPGAPRSIEEGAASVLWGVLVPADGPTGGVFQDGVRTE